MSFSFLLYVPCTGLLGISLGRYKWKLLIPRKKVILFPVQDILGLINKSREYGDGNKPDVSPYPGPPLMLLIILFCLAMNKVET